MLTVPAAFVGCSRVRLLPNSMKIIAEPVA
jgi:hypothetical protein